MLNHTPNDTTPTTVAFSGAMAKAEHPSCNARQRTPATNVATDAGVLLAGLGWKWGRQEEFYR